MEKPLRILHLEDEPLDIELLEGELRRLQLSYALEQVDAEPAFVRSLQAAPPHIILSDYSLKGFDGLRALALAQQHAPGIPFVIVTGSQNEEIAVECMKAGAADYVIKQRLSRLGPAIERALEMKRAQDREQNAIQALHENQRILKTLMSNLPGLAYRCRNDRDWTMEFVSEGCFDLTGYQPEDLLQNRKLSYAQLIHLEDREAVWEGVLHALKQNQPFRLQYRIVTAKGEQRWVWEQGRGVMSEAGELIALEGFIHDISDRVRAQKNLRESEQRFRRFTEAAVEGISILEDGILLDANPAYAKLFGYNLEVIVGRSVLDWTAPESREVVATHIQTGDERPYEATGIRKDGSKFIMEICGKNILFFGRKARVAAIRDVTERRNLEAQLRQAQKMESVGQLAAGVAHDFNNILTIIQGNTGLMMSDPGITAEAQDSLRQISTAAGRAANLTGQLLAFSRRQIMQPKILNLNEGINNLAKMLHRLIGEQIKLQLNCAEKLPPIHVDEGMMEQIVLNLAVNARDAMPKGGSLTISTQAVDIDERFLPFHSEARVGRFVCLRITDTGTGIEASIRDRIFDPFFTTKEVGKGTGLGLATVYGIVKQHQGWIEVESQVRCGSTFSVYLPVHISEPNQEKADQNAVTVPGRPGNPIAGGR